MLVRHAVLLVLALAGAASGRGEDKTLVLLYTNDLHDHVRADYDGSGGLAYVAGYIRGVRSRRADVLVVDAGDVMEKGDLVAFRTQSRVTCEAMGRVGYDAFIPGNHDTAYGDDHIESCAALAPNMAVLAVNLLRADGTPRFPASKVFTRSGMRVGVIGVFKPRDELSLDLEETAERVAAEARRLEGDVHLIVVAAHLGVRDCANLSRVAPAVDVFVSGHTHQVLHRPQVVPETGAIVVQAGAYAEYVGRLELRVDTETGEILGYAGRLVPMDHSVIPRDEEMQAWVAKVEREVAPEASQRVATTERALSYAELAWLGAEGLRSAAGVDVGFCHASQIIRARLPVGPVDVNAVFRTGGQRAHDVVEVTLTGAEIHAYAEGLASSRWGGTQWSGFHGRYVQDGERVRLESNLEPHRRYRVVMPEKEWDTRFRRYFRQTGDVEGVDVGRLLGLRPLPVPTSFTEGVVGLLESEDGAVGPGRLARRIRREALEAE
jgi:2',3'-cyclic-nucleotide 2'-phosphodiesterase (5'-nucleotidase family)